MPKPEPSELLKQQPRRPLSNMRLLAKREVRDATNEAIRKNIARGIQMAKKVDDSVAKLEKEKKKSEEALQSIIQYNLTQSERLTKERLALQGEVARLQAERAAALVPIEQEAQDARERMETAMAKLEEALRAKEEAIVHARTARNAEASAERKIHEARVAQEESSEAAMLAQKHQLDSELATAEVNRATEIFKGWFAEHSEELKQTEAKIEVRESLLIEEDERLARLRKQLDIERKRIESRQHQLKLALDKLKK